MLVAEIMTSNPVTITGNAPAARALHIMDEMGFHQLPVMSSAGHLVGIVTQRDCRQAVGANGHPHKHTTVNTVMSPAPIIVEPQTLVQEAARLMTEHHVRCLPVMRGETLVGILTASDLLIAFMRTLEPEPTPGS
jgi:acetoin utilization protein AcuB